MKNVHVLDHFLRGFWMQGSSPRPNHSIDDRSPESIVAQQGFRIVALVHDIGESFGGCMLRGCFRMICLLVCLCGRDSPGNACLNPRTYLFRIPYCDFFI